MRKFLLALLFSLFWTVSCFAAEVSSDTMILEWTTTKVWVNKGELCMSGTFKNYREDIVITELNNFTTKIIFTGENGEQFIFTGSPKKIPICRINGKTTKAINFNFGSFDHKFKKWLTDEEYSFTYVGVR